MTKDPGKPAGLPSKKRVLIVDDDPSVQKLLVKTIERAGYAVLACANGFEAGICVVRFRPHLIMLDLFMPYMDGFQVCRQLKSDPDTAAIKIIAISGHASPSNIDKAFRCGADRFVQKPFARAQLVREVAALLNPEKAMHAAPYD